MTTGAGHDVRHGLRGLFGIAVLALVCVPAGAQQAPTDPTQSQPATTVPRIDIIGASPLLGSGVDRDTVPAETNVLKGDDLTRGGTLIAPDVTRALNEEVGGVNLEFGVGQSLSADHVLSRVRGIGAAGHAARARRLRQRRSLQPAFGDTVNFDLMPDLAIDQMNLEGSNPVFGLNALGGALNVQLKNGFTYHGGEIELSRRLVRHLRRRLPVRQAERQHRGLCRGQRDAPGRLARPAILRHREFLRRCRLARQHRRTAFQRPVRPTRS